jgi:hypothetical protein
MTDDTSGRANGDQRRIDLERNHEIEYWAKK